MRRNKIFSRALNKVSSLTLSGALLTTFLPSASWAMEKDDYLTQKTPPVILKYILSFFTPEELVKIAPVSKKIKTISENKQLWERFGVTSKENYVFYRKNPLITIYNDGPTIPYEIGIAYGTGQYFTTPESKMKGDNFNLHILNVELKENEEKTIRVLDLPKHIKILEPKEIYGVTFPTQAKLDLFSPSIDVDFGRCLETMQQQDMNKIPLFIFESMGSKSKFKLQVLGGEIGIVGTRCLKEYKDK